MWTEVCRCATQLEAERPTWAARPKLSLRDPRRDSIPELCLSAQIGSELTPVAFKAGFIQSLGVCKRICVIIHDSNMQMKDLKPHCYEIIVFRVKMKINGVKIGFDV